MFLPDIYMLLSNSYCLIHLHDPTHVVLLVIVVVLTTAVVTLESRSPRSHKSAEALGRSEKP